MSTYYPVYLDLTGKPVVVIGGGQIAERKVLVLLESDARVTVVSPELTDGLASLAESGRIQSVRRAYRHGDLAGAFLAIIGTDDSATNQEAAAEARAAHVLVNAVDDIANCDFIAPAVIRRGDLTVALSTNGKSPAMARWARQELESVLTPEYGDLLKVLEHVRIELRRKNLRVDPERWQTHIDATIRSLVHHGKLKEAEERLFHALSSGAPEETVTSAS